MNDFLRDYMDVEQANDQYSFYALENVTTKQDIVGKILSSRMRCKFWDARTIHFLSRLMLFLIALLLVDLLTERQLSRT